MNPMSLLLFDHENMRCIEATLVPASRFGHTFGGSADDYGIRFTNLEHPPHLLFRLNLADLSIPSHLPKEKWLPLCYPFSYATYEGEFAYRLVSDHEIEFVYPESVYYNPDFPYD